MSTHHLNPENALRKAQDFAAHGLNEAALEPLTSILGSRRYRQWQPTHELIMEQYIDLAVKLRKNMREPLVKYRAISQENNVASLEMIINMYRERTEARTEKARLEAAEKNIEEENNEDFEESPGSIMLQAVSGESAKDRQDQQILTPWVKYLWEAYRTILELLKNNGKLQLVYQTTARAAFAYCRKYKRPVEFRRLCDMLRKHLVTIGKYQNQSNSVDLQSTDTQRMYLETRFQQLEIASDLELWQEAYRAIEDIHESMNLLKTPQTPSLMKTYYNQLSKIFWASGNFLFHAYSLSKYFALRCNEGIDPAEKTELASSVLLATLAIEPTSLNEDGEIFNNENEENLRLASMLGFRKETPTRRRLISGLVNRGLLAQASPSAVAIYKLTEEKFGPLTLKKNLDPLLASFEKPQLSKYVEPLKKLAILRILQQISKVYKTMKFTSLQKIVPDTSFAEIEMIVMDVNRFCHLSIRIDHRGKTLSFLDEDMESQRMRKQLSKLAVAMEKVTDKIEVVSAEGKALERLRVFQSVERGVEEEHNQVFVRKEEIEKRKQELENRDLEKKKRQAELEKEATRKRREDERKRLEDERILREAEKRKKQAEREEEAEKRKLAAKIQATLDTTPAAAKGKAAKKLQKITQNVEEVDKAAIIEAQAALAASQKNEAERKLKEQNKKLDYLTRAMRCEEKDLLKKSQVEHNKRDKEEHEADFLKYAETHKAKHTQAVAEKKRLARFGDQRAIVFEKLMADRKKRFEIEMEEFEQRQQERAEERERLEREREERRKEEEEQREREEEEQRQREAEERRIREQKAEEERIKREEREEAARRQDEITRKQREREAELDAKEAERRNARREPAPREESGGGAWRPRGRDDDRRGGFDDRRGGFGRDDDRRSGFGESGFRSNRRDFDDRRGGFDDRRDGGGFGGGRDREGGGEDRWRRSDGPPARGRSPRRDERSFRREEPREERSFRREEPRNEEPQREWRSARSQPAQPERRAGEPAPQTTRPPPRQTAAAAAAAAAPADDGFTVVKKKKSRKKRR